MKNKIKLVLFIYVVISAGFVMYINSASSAAEKTLEVQTNYSLPQYQNDTTRAIASYERLLNRFMDMTERNLVELSHNMAKINSRLNSIETKLTRIENALDIKPKSSEENKKYEKKPEIAPQGGKKSRP